MMTKEKMILEIEEAHGTRSQHHFVVKRLASYGKITSMEAFQLYGITRLAAIIFVLRERGFPITTTMIERENRFGRMARFAEYKLSDDYRRKLPAKLRMSSSK